MELDVVVLFGFFFVLEGQFYKFVGGSGMV